MAGSSTSCWASSWSVFCVVVVILMDNRLQFQIVLLGVRQRDQAFVDQHLLTIGQPAGLELTVVLGCIHQVGLPCVAEYLLAVQVFFLFGFCLRCPDANFLKVPNSPFV